MLNTNVVVKSLSILNHPPNSSIRQKEAYLLLPDSLQTHLKGDRLGGVLNLLPLPTARSPYSDGIPVLGCPCLVPSHPDPEVEISSVTQVLHTPGDQEEEEFIVEADALGPPPPVLLVLQGVQVRGGGDRGREAGILLIQLVMNEILIPPVGEGEVLHDGADGHHGGAGEYRAVPHSMVTHCLVLLLLCPRKVDKAAIGLVLARGGKLGSYSLCCQGSHIAKLCAA